MKQQQDFTKTIEWETKQEPAVLAWQIKTIWHQWQKVGYPVIFILIICYISLFIGITLNWIKDSKSTLPIILMTGACAGIMVFSMLFFGEVRRKTWFVYRLTPITIEIAHWRAYPKILFVLIRWIFAIMGVVVMIIGIALGEAAVAMAGPVGMILSLGTWAVTKNYQETMTAYDQSPYSWAYVQKAYYDSKRNVIMLHHVHPPFTAEERKKYKEEQGFTDERLDRVIMECDFYLFPTPALTEEILNITQQYTPKGVTLHHQKVTLPDMI